VLPPLRRPSRRPARPGAPASSWPPVAARGHRPGRRAALVGLLALAAWACVAVVPAAAVESAAHLPGTREILIVGNNHAGTADVVDPVTFRRLFRMNVVPDLPERMREIEADPAALAAFLLIREQIGMGHDQLVDDLFPSPDGRVVYVSRPSLADVVAIDLRTHRILWRTPVDGIRADHMAISPDGSRVLVSASTARKVHVIDTKDGRIVTSFPSGDQPHESNYSADGRSIFHASIGTVFLPFDEPGFDAMKGLRVFQIVDARTFQVTRSIDMRKKLDAFGRPDIAAAVRPMAVAPGERYVYLQFSFLHGFAEYDLQEDRITRIAELPLSDASRNLRRTDYVLDSAHHGLAINPEGTKLCAAGTMSNYAAIVRRDTLKATIVPVGDKPYWSTNSMDGKHCYVSVSGEDRVAVLSYAEEREIASIPVGDHPQRIRIGRLRVSEGVADPVPAARIAPAGVTLRASSARFRRAPFRVRLAGRVRLSRATPPDACTGRVRLDATLGGRRVASRTVRVRRAGTACTFAGTLRVPTSVARGGTRRLSVTARYGGATLLGPARSRPVAVRVG
jgi:DNA-binding beta-propeller fold protein YncE